MFDSILLYVCADNDLSDYADRDIAELAAAPVTQCIQVDQRIRGWGDAQPNSYRLVRCQGVEQRTLLDAELNTGDVDTLRDFLAWCRTQGVHLEEALFIFWGHGEGWTGNCKDFLNEDRLDLHEIRRSLAGCAFRAVGFDACIMASLEVAHVLAASTPLLLASQEVEPKAGWHYGQLDFQRHDPCPFFEEMARQYVAQPSEKPLCLSLLALRPLPRLLDGLNALFAEAGAAIGAFAAVVDGLPRIANGEYVDLCTLLEGLAAMPEVREPAEALRALIEAEIVRKVYTNRAGYRGLSLWLPKAVRAYKLERYGALPLSEACPAFMEVLRRYVGVKT